MSVPASSFMLDPVSASVFTGPEQQLKAVVTVKGTATTNKNMNKNINNNNTFPNDPSCLFPCFHSSQLLQGLHDCK